MRVLGVLLGTLVFLTALAQLRQEAKRRESKRAKLRKRKARCARLSVSVRKSDVAPN